MNEEDLMHLGLKRPAARLLCYLLANPGPKMQNDIILSGQLKQPYVSIAARELDSLGFLVIQEQRNKRGAPSKAYSLAPIAEIKQKLMRGIELEYEQKSLTAMQLK